MAQLKKIGVMTGGGDCPGLNAVIRAVVKRATILGYQTLGFRQSWKGLLNNDFIALDRADVDEILYRGGTILKSAKVFPLDEANGIKRIEAAFTANQLAGMVVIGGESTLGVAATLHAQSKLPMVGIPKTIDNDVMGSQFSIGFSSAVDTVASFLDRLRTTAYSHSRVFIVEIMGRNTGWLTLFGGIAGGADMIIVPERPIAIDEIVARLDLVRQRGKTYAIIAVSEGAKIFDRDGKLMNIEKAIDHKDPRNYPLLGGIAERIKQFIEVQTDWEVRAEEFGHLQRGGSPDAFDRMLGTCFGMKAVDLIHQQQFGLATVLKDGCVDVIALEAVGEGAKPLPDHLCQIVDDIIV